MKIIVCVKQVPAVTEVKIDPKTNTLIREGVSSELNPFDEFAVEEALRTRERCGGKVTAVSMGPSQAEEVLNICLAMGVDESVLLTDPLLVGSDTLATSFALSKVIERVDYEIIFCGQESTDSSTGQVGPGIAEHLGIPQVTFVSKVEKIAKREVTVHQETDRGYNIIECRLPLLLSVVKGINEPRTPLLGDSGKVVKKMCLADLDCSPTLVGMEGSPTQVINISYAENRRESFFSIPTNLPAHERIKLIMSGGVKEKENNLILQGISEENIQKVVGFITNHFSS